MSRHTRHAQPERPPGWAEFASDNAVSLLDQRDLKIERLREQVAKLSRSLEAVRCRDAKFCELLVKLFSDRDDRVSPGVKEQIAELLQASGYQL